MRKSCNAPARNVATLLSAISSALKLCYGFNILSWRPVGDSNPCFRRERPAETSTKSTKVVSFRQRRTGRLRTKVATFSRSLMRPTQGSRICRQSAHAEVVE